MVNNQEELFARPLYEQTLIELLHNPAIKVLTGVRRCGKSCLLRLLNTYLQSQGVPADNVLFIKIDSPTAPLEPSATWLNETIANFLASSSKADVRYLLLDEIQDVPSWERVLRRYCNEENVSIFVTGSNAHMLSSDLATYLSGRYLQIPIYPLSFKEYLAFKKIEISPHPESPLAVENHFQNYLTYGGMPAVALANSSDIPLIQRELQAIKDTVLLNDVAKRFEVHDIALLETLVRYLFSTSGNLFSLRKIADSLTSAGRKTYASTLENYLMALQKAYLVHSCEQAGIQGKKVLSPRKKYYPCDTGLRNQETGFSSNDLGFQLENVVYLELRRRGFEVHVGTLRSGEVDFVATRGSDRLSIQVCTTLLDGQTRERELTSLRMLTDAYPRLIVTLDRIGLGTTPEGIHIVNLLDWLLAD